MRTEIELLPTSCSGVILVSDHCTVFLTHPLTDIRVAASVTITTNIAGTILCVWSWTHVQVFLGENTRGLDSSPGGRGHLSLFMRRVWDLEGHLWSLGREKESALGTSQLSMAGLPGDKLSAATSFSCLLHYARCLADLQELGA